MPGKPGWCAVNRGDVMAEKLKVCWISAGV